jgi:hypothetical protein
MRKMLLVAALLFWIPTVSANTDPTAPPQTYQEFVQAHEEWNRKAVIKDKDGKLLKDLGGNLRNPFPSKAACVEGMAQDTASIYLFLQRNGVDIEALDVDVTCEPAGKDS